MLKLMLMFFFFTYPLAAQQSDVVVDSTTANNDSVKVVQTRQANEFMLETIRIEAVIEKPNVTLIPKKIETMVGEVPFNRRSFDKELNALPPEVIDMGGELERGRKMENLKKSLAKDK